MLIIDAEFTEIKSFDEKLADFVNQLRYASNPIPVRKTKVGQRKRTKKKTKYNFRSIENWKKFWIEIRPFCLFPFSFVLKFKRQLTMEVLK